ncbi:MAG: hypothetical protein AB7T86_16985 [Xanthobacteraceae bacterium]
MTFRAMIFALGFALSAMLGLSSAQAANFGPLSLLAQGAPSLVEKVRCRTVSEPRRTCKPRRNGIMACGTTYVRRTVCTPRAQCRRVRTCHTRYYAGKRSSPYRVCSTRRVC